MRVEEEIDIDRALERAPDLIQEFLVAGRERDAFVVARLMAHATKDAQPAISEEELDRRLAEANADIEAGRVTPDDEVWAALKEK
jgi:hypothetical protein